MSAYNPPSQEQSIFNPTNYSVAINKTEDAGFDELTATTGIFSNLLIGSDNVATTLNEKQATIADGDLTIARTNGLQSALDGKQATITYETEIASFSITESLNIINPSNTNQYLVLNYASYFNSQRLVNNGYYVSDTNTTFGAGVLYYDVIWGQTSNVKPITDFLTQSSNKETFTAVIAGYYKLNAIVNMGSGTSSGTDHNFRLRIIKNSTDILSTSYNTFIDAHNASSVSNNAVINLVIGDIITYRIDLTKSGGMTFTTSLENSKTYEGSSLLVEYLGASFGG